MDELSYRVQYMLNATLGNVIYGPLKARYSEEESAITGRPNWAVNRYPEDYILKGWASDMAKWPLGASCSPFASWVIAAYLGLANEFNPRWGRSMTKMLRDKMVAPFTQVLNKGHRKYLWDELPHHIPWEVFSWRQRGHTGVGLNCDKLNLYHPDTKQPLEGIWVWVADGYFADSETRVQHMRKKYGLSWRTIIRRRFSCKPLVLETAEQRARRQRETLEAYKSKRHRKRYEKRIRFSIVGLLPPMSLDPEDRNLILPLDGEGNALPFEEPRDIQGVSLR